MDFDALQNSSDQISFDIDSDIQQLIELDQRDNLTLSEKQDEGSGSLVNLEKNVVRAPALTILKGRIISSHQDRFRAIRNWEGVVTAVCDDTFFASVKLVNDKNTLPKDELEIDKDNIDVGDRNLLKVGSVFYLTLGYRKRNGSQVVKETRLVFRRLPQWSGADIAQAEEDTDKLWIKLQSQKNGNTAEGQS